MATTSERAVTVTCPACQAKFRAKAELAEVLKRLLKEEQPDLSYTLQKIGDDLKIYPGDMEEFVESVRWILHAIVVLSELEGVNSVKDLADQVLTRLLPSEPRPTIPPARP